MPAGTRGGTSRAKKTTRKARTKSTRTRSAGTRSRSSGRSGGTTATRRRSATATRRKTTTRKPAATRRTASRRQLRDRAVSEVMSTEPMTIVSSEPLVSAARMMRDDDIGAVIVLGDADGSVCGIVTDRDIVVRAIAEEREPGQTTVGAICSAELVTVESDDTVDSALAMMRARAIRRVPVVENGRAVGIFSIGDLAERFDERSALADISAAPPNS